ncbi:hypothetical protein SAMN05421504_10516 [Amycolatopsis xylanica]|uniref:Uncharacterized protein n=1 Tax=Amycolatopsis xylanica TaxID=589385 RepID=A0A1H3IKW1_9PSEU|nr:hypothetical protein [Amycolatopsis xylanica]SDY27929.1 hypothetical protein SAMN05421504_10516 [Amycolatopsis xylanica]
MNTFDAQAVWPRLSAELRAEIDDLVVARRNIQAIVAFRDRSGIEPRPGIANAAELLQYRLDALLGQEGA